jgi:hypothetical protein
LSLLAFLWKKSRAAAWFVLLGAGVAFAVFIIPHSI